MGCCYSVMRLKRNLKGSVIGSQIFDDDESEVYIATERQELDPDEIVDDKESDEPDDDKQSAESDDQEEFISLEPTFEPTSDKREKHEKDSPFPWKQLDAVTYTFPHEQLVHQDANFAIVLADPKQCSISVAGEKNVIVSFAPPNCKAVDDLTLSLDPIAKEAVKFPFASITDDGDYVVLRRNVFFQNKCVALLSANISEWNVRMKSAKPSTGINEALAELINPEIDDQQSVKLDDTGAELSEEKPNVPPAAEVTSTASKEPIDRDFLTGLLLEDDFEPVVEEQEPAREHSSSGGREKRTQEDIRKRKSSKVRNQSNVSEAESMAEKKSSTSRGKDKEIRIKVSSAANQMLKNSSPEAQAADAAKMSKTKLTQLISDGDILHLTDIDVHLHDYDLNSGESSSTAPVSQIKMILVRSNSSKSPNSTTDTKTEAPDSVKPEVQLMGKLSRTVEKVKRLQGRNSDSQKRIQKAEKALNLYGRVIGLDPKKSEDAKYLLGTIIVDTSKCNAFRNLSEERVVAFLREIRPSVNKQTKVFRAACNWIKGDFNDRVKYAPGVLDCVDYGKMSDGELIQCHIYSCDAGLDKCNPSLNREGFKRLQKRKHEILQNR